MNKALSRALQLVAVGRQARTGVVAESRRMLKKKWQREFGLVLHRSRFKHRRRECHFFNASSLL
jgi:hypothetical protein